MYKNRLKTNAEVIAFATAAQTGENITIPARDPRMAVKDGAPFTPASIPVEISQAELDALERNPVKPPKRQPKSIASGPPRDELGRFTKVKKKGNS